MDRRDARADATSPILPDGDRGGAVDGTAGLLADSRKVAVWTLVSRITGFGRVAIMAAVLGPTYFGNIFQTMAFLPSLLFSLLGGSLVGAILVPPLVRWIDGQDEAAFRRLADGFLGVLLALLLMVGVLVVLLWAPVVSLVTAAVDDAGVRHQQQEAGHLLLILTMPQLLLYGVMVVGTAVQHARGRFALAAAASVGENLASMGVLAASALAFGTGTDLGAVSTAAVALHAALQWWGAFRAGVPLLPRPGWSDPEIRRLLRIAITSSGNTVLYNLVFFTVLVVAGSVPGGVVAFQIGLNFAYLPVALGAVPVASAQLPRLARSHNAGDAAAFRTTFLEGFAFSRFLTLPASFLLVGMSGALAAALAFGEMATPVGIAMVAASIGSLGAGVFGEASTTLLTTAAYARRDGMAPLRAMAVRTVLALGGAGGALVAVEGTAVLWALGASVSVANLVAAGYLYRAVLRDIPAAPWSQRARFLGELAASALSMAAAGSVAFWLADGSAGHAKAIGTVAAAGCAGAMVYLVLQWLRGSREFGYFLSVVFGAGPADVAREMRPAVRMGRLRTMWPK
jgi:putative peptidoglycan lipid II flippase